MRLKILTKRRFLFNLILITIFINIASCYWEPFSIRSFFDKRLIIKDFSNLKVRLASLQQELINKIADTEKQRLKEESEKVDNMYDKTHRGFDSNNNRERYLKDFTLEYKFYNNFYLELDKLLKSNAKIEEFENPIINKDIQYYKIYRQQASTLFKLSYSYVLKARHGTLQDLNNLRLNGETTFNFIEFYSSHFLMLERILRRFPYLNIDKLVYKTDEGLEGMINMIEM